MRVIRSNPQTMKIVGLQVGDGKREGIIEKF